MNNNNYNFTAPKTGWYTFHSGNNSSEPIQLPHGCVINKINLVCDSDDGYVNSITMAYEEYAKKLAMPKCECGAAKVYANEPNLEYLHATYCPLHLAPDWINKLNKENGYAK